MRMLHLKEELEQPLNAQVQEDRAQQLLHRKHIHPGFKVQDLCQQMLKVEADLAQK